MQKLVKKNYNKIGILGGTFDPPHIGHLHISKIALKKLKLDVQILQKDIFKEENLISGSIVARAFKPLPIILELVEKNFKNR